MMTSSSVQAPAVQYIDASSLKPEERLKAVKEVNESIGGNWSRYTGFIDGDFIRRSGAAVFILAQKAGKCSGYLVAREEAPGKLYIPFVAVHKDEQRSGVGSGLMLETISKMRALGMSILTLHCRPIPLGFYQHFGEKHGIEFKREEVGQYPNGDAVNFVTFTLPALKG